MVYTVYAMKNKDFNDQTLKSLNACHYEEFEKLYKGRVMFSVPENIRWAIIFIEIGDDLTVKTKSIYIMADPIYMPYEEYWWLKNASWSLRSIHWP